MLRAKFWIGMGICAFLLSACSSVEKKDEQEKVILTGPEDTELPPDLAEKFTIDEVPTPSVPDVSDSGRSDEGSSSQGDKKTTAANSDSDQKKKKSETQKDKKEVAQSKDKKKVEFPDRRPSFDPIWLNEKLSYDVTYFGMVAGTLEMQVLPYRKIQDRKVYHVKARAQSSKMFSLFYELDDYVETFFDFEGMFSHRFHLVLKESKQSRNSIELNDSIKGQTFYWDRWKHYKRGYHEKKEYKPIPRFAQDSLSALYYLRTLPLSVGKVFNVPIISEGKHWEAVVTVVKKDPMKTAIGEVDTFKMKIDTRFNGVLQKRGDSHVWMTADRHRYLVKVEAKVKIGSVKAVITDMERGFLPRSAIDLKPVEFAGVPLN